MYATALLALAASASAATIQGFNYGSTNPDGSFASQQDFQNQFAAAKQLPGTNGGFTAARLYTTIQGGSSNTFTEAIPAAIATKTRLLLGMWASSGSATISDEITALQAAISKYGSQFTDLVDGISVGSEDLYRITSTAMTFDPSSVGAGPDAIASYINQVRTAIKGTPLSGASIGHVDTWTAWVNSSNSAVVDACDWIGMDAYPYFQDQMANSIQNAESLFDSAWQQTQSFSKGKPVWVTETGWPLSGKTANLAIPSTQNAQQYWEAVGCGQLFGKVNTYWYTYYDGTPNPSFGLVPSVGGQPKFDLSCNQKPTISMGTSVMASATGGGSSSPTNLNPSGGSSSSGNGTVGSGTTGTPLSPTGVGTGTGSGSSSSSSSPSKGAANSNAVSFFGLVGAAFAAALAF